MIRFAYTILWQVVLAFLEIFGTESTPMECALCGPYPKWLGFDGVSVALSKDKVLWDTIDTIHPRDHSTTPPAASAKKQ